MATHTENKTPIGLLAGAGRFPILFAQKCRDLGMPLVTVGLLDEASPELRDYSQGFHWCGIAKLGRMIRCFKNAGCKQVVMAGKVQKVKMNAPWRIFRFLPDWRMIKVFFLTKRSDSKDDTLLLGLIREFAADGMAMTSALEICPELLVQAGLLTKRSPNQSELSDIDFGWTLAKEMGRLDVGQSVMVRERAVLAVEAIEGTDQAILRAGGLCPRGGFVVVKVAKPQQDMRFDVPTVGTTTIENMKKAGARVLAIEAGKTIVLDQPEVVSLADRYGITIISRAA